MPVIVIVGSPAIKRSALEGEKEAAEGAAANLIL